MFFVGNYANSIQYHKSIYVISYIFWIIGHLIQIVYSFYNKDYWSAFISIGIIIITIVSFCIRSFIGLLVMICIFLGLVATVYSICSFCFFISLYRQFLRFPVLTISHISNLYHYLCWSSLFVILFVQSVFILLNRFFTLPLLIILSPSLVLCILCGVFHSLVFLVSMFLVFNTICS